MRRSIRNSVLIIIWLFLAPVIIFAKDFKITETPSADLIKINGGKLNNIEVGAKGSVIIWQGKNPYTIAKFEVTEVQDRIAVAIIKRKRKPGDTIAVGNTIQFDALLMATLSITTDPPYAEVTIDKDPSVKAPVKNKILSPGPHEILISAPKYSTEIKKIDLGPGENLEVPVIKLLSEMGQLKFDTDPSGAKVAINGTFKGLTPFDQPLLV